MSVITINIPLKLTPYILDYSISKQDLFIIDYIIHHSSKNTDLEFKFRPFFYYSA